MLKTWQILLQTKSLKKCRCMSVSHNYSNSYGNHGQTQPPNSKVLLSSVLFGSILFGISRKEKREVINERYNSYLSKLLSVKAEESFEAGEKRPDLPTYRSEEVQKHNTIDSFWVTYKYGVYDVTAFIHEHPGGLQILNAGGLGIEPFWNVYGMHKTEAVYKLLEKYRIGNLHKDDIMEWTGDELWVQEPARDPRLLVKAPRPFNAEIPLKLIVENFQTPNELFFVRSHMPVPELNADEHKLSILIEDKAAEAVEFSLKDLERFRKAELWGTLMCAGNRRHCMKQVKGKEVKGIDWLGGAISNAKWSGVYLRDVLICLGVNPEDTEGKHVIFVGADIDATGENFNTSIPLTMAMDPNSKILLATKMNDEPIPRDHGYPLRVIVPGSAAVRSVKWLEKIIVSNEESSGHWHLKDYRGFNSSKNWETADFSRAPPVYTLPVTSAICDPGEGDTVVAKDGFVEVKGYAYSGGGSKILRVDLTSDCGQTWVEAEPIAVDSAPPKRHYSWYLWKAKVPINKDCKKVELWVKATDSNFNTQPEKADHIWNIRGILCNSYHKIGISVEHTSN